MKAEIIAIGSELLLGQIVDTNSSYIAKILADNGVELVRVSAVGDDFALSGGTCGKGHKEWVPVSSGGPHLKLKARLG